MFSLRSPNPDEVRAFIQDQAQEPFSYARPGLTRQLTGTERPHELGIGEYVLDHYRAPLGFSEKTYRKACALLRQWEMFRLGWVRLHSQDAPVEVGTVVAVEARVAGMVWLNAARIVYTVDEQGPIQRFGFAYGTLPDHAEAGEERFLIEYSAKTGAVTYDLLAFSRPNHWLVRLGYPLTRRLQRRFARDSLAVMQQSSR